MRIEILKTSDISDSLWQAIVDGFNESFDLNYDIKDLKNGFYTSTILGYSYHGIAFSDDGEVMGYVACYPMYYKNGYRAINTGGVYVRPKYREDFLLFAKITKALRMKFVEEGYDWEMGVPNHNAKDYAIRINRYKHVGNLNYYLLPVNFSKVLNKSYLRLLDCLYRPFLVMFLHIVYLLTILLNAKEKESTFELETSDNFFEKRFKDKTYKHYASGKISSYFSIVNESGTNVAYIIDFRQNNIRTSKALAKTLFYIWKNENVDAFMYVGFLKLKQFALIKVPHKFDPKPLPLVVYPLSKELLKNTDFFDESSWNYGLLNFDVR